MFFSPRIATSTKSSSLEIERLAEAFAQADAVIVGAGAGLSTAAGLTYSGERFRQWFGDFEERFDFADMYSGGFYPFPDEETTWAYWSRMVWCNRYAPGATPLYRKLAALLADKDHFVLTTNVDHQFQLAGIDRHRLFYTQGDYGLWQCSRPCHAQTYDNEQQVKAMVEQQKDLRVPSELLPRCPVCGAPMTMNLRCDDTFVEDEGWHAAAERYEEFLRRHRGMRTLFLELGVGSNTPGIIKYPFWRMTAANPRATYACVNLGEAYAPMDIERSSILIDAGIEDAIEGLSEVFA